MLRASKRLNIWLQKVVHAVEKGIHEFWSSIILSHAKSYMTSPSSSPTVTVGEPKNFGRRFANAVSFAQTATDDIQSSNRSTTHTMTSKPNCTEYSSDSISLSRTEEILLGLENGTLDLTTITLAEYIQVSFLGLVSGSEVHIEQKVTYGGQVFNLHACVSEIRPMQSLMGKQEQH